MHNAGNGISHRLARLMGVRKQFEYTSELLKKMIAVVAARTFKGCAVLLSWCVFSGQSIRQYYQQLRAICTHYREFSYRSSSQVNAYSHADKSQDDRELDQQKLGIEEYTNRTYMHPGYMINMCRIVINHLIYTCFV